MMVYLILIDIVSHLSGMLVNVCIKIQTMHTDVMIQAI